MADTRAEILLPQTTQHRVWGWALRTFGWSLRIAGSLIGIVSIQASRTSIASQSPGALFHGLPFWARVLIWAGFLLLGTVLFMTGRWLAGRGRQHLARVIDSLDALVRRPYVLYLRPFADDLLGSSMPTAAPGSSPFASFTLSGRTHEESLSRVFRSFGSMVAVGRPGERLPLPGAHRLYLPLDDWQDTVRALIGRARLVVLGTGPGPGTVKRPANEEERLDRRNRKRKTTAAARESVEKGAEFTDGAHQGGEVADSGVLVPISTKPSGLRS